MRVPSRVSAPERTLRLVCVLLALLVPGRVAVGQDHHHHQPPGAEEALGAVTFPVSCAAEVRPAFERSVAMLHSFWFEAAERAFREVAERDPGCGMASWGLAMTMLGNPFTRVPPSAERLRIGRDAAERAVAQAAAATEREQRYAAAVAAYYGGAERPHLERMRDHQRAMEELYRRHPEDPEAAAFFARSLVANAPPDDQSFALLLRAAELLEPLFEAAPMHPGLAHYIIHAYDVPALAERGRAAAFAYADIAPSAPHALHMPSHIFTRLGYWEESIETNTRSARAEPDPNAAVHPMDYKVYAYLQLGRDAAAREVVERAVQNPDRFYGGLLGYNFAAMPARFALERDDWGAAAALRLPVGAAAYVEALTRFARGIGAARGGGAGAADAVRQEAAELGRLKARLDAEGDAYWAGVVEAQRLATESWAARAGGDEAEALRLARAAAELEETFEKHAVTPGPLLPARELLGDLLFELDRPADALEAYRRTLEREPRRARALRGAALAAERAGRAELARTYYTELLELMATADAERPEPALARRYLGK
jgi:tetratricopeptide (TPR) repeat protein